MRPADLMVTSGPLMRNTCASCRFEGYLECILLVYTFVINKHTMKILSLKLDDKIFDEAEEITAHLQLARNRYINEAVSIYNLYHKRRMLKKQLVKESKLTALDSMEILHEFEMLMDED